MELNEFILPPDVFMREFKRLNPELWHEWELKWAKQKVDNNARTKEWNINNKAKRREYRTKYNKQPIVKEKHSIRKHARRALELNCTGSHTIQEWRNKKAQYNNRCAYCGHKVKLTKDHVIPLTKGGTNNISNIVPACMDCNRQKNVNHKDLQLVLG
jgi:5-methylcytosine-specific restriction endonuclease McrA